MRAFFDYFLTPLEGRGKAFPLAEPPCRMADGTDGATRKRSSCPSRPQRGTGLGSPIRVGQTGTRIANQSRKSMKRGTNAGTLLLLKKESNETEGAAQDGGEQATPIRRRARALLLTVNAQQKQHSRSGASARSAVSVGAATTPPRNGRKTAPASISGRATSTPACLRQPSRCRSASSTGSETRRRLHAAPRFALSTSMLRVRLAGAVRTVQKRILRDESTEKGFRAESRSRDREPCEGATRAPRP